MSNLFSRFQKVLPQHQLSRFIGALAASENAAISKIFITQFAKAYNISLYEAERKSLSEYVSFNDFFTRSLEPSARPMPTQRDLLASPVDGAISQLGKIDDSQLMQAKGHKYSLHSLAGDAARGLDNGDYCTIYLAPNDYHRIHLPFAGELEQTFAVPGALFSVNAATQEGIEGLFCRNERLVCRFNTEFGPMLVVLVGALIVASIETVWSGPASPYSSQAYNNYSIELNRGDEIGRFLLGSTVICCFPRGAVELNPAVKIGRKIRLGENLGRVL
jgi:phosphatidylserine decarboxylase